ncbi:unnamed protein product [Caenorhabditis bovis]|uniref:Uncharacterized protein n=1 Tax=Caenorhabditis bovis TaxID=2654633 RepID=A0A8S1FAY7_9PELO|nr:unnamed protein product [Caenorhabditis bovis]
MFMRFFNTTCAIENGTIVYYNVVFALQLIFITFHCFTLSYYILNVVIDIRTKQYVTNVQKLHHCIYFSCVSGHVCLFAQKLLLLIGSPAALDTAHPAFFTISFIRASFCFPGFYGLSGFVVERWLATYFLDDYEKNQRPKLTILIVICIFVFAVLSAIDYHQGETSIRPATIFLAVSVIGYIGNQLNLHVNRKYYYRCKRADGGGYSLAQRVQISENIQFSFFFTQFAKSISFFAIIGPLSILVDNFEISCGWKNANTVFFDTMMPLYGVVTPYVVYYHNPKYQKELRHLMYKLKKCAGLGTTHASISPQKPRPTIKDTFGQELMFDTNQQTDYYFRQLQSEWNI